MACRNDKAPDGISTYAHLSDGRMDLILIKDCSRLEYLRQLLRLARKGADPFDLPFVETHKVMLLKRFWLNLDFEMGQIGTHKVVFGCISDFYSDT
jgi:hypothetical protein